MQVLRTERGQLDAPLDAAAVAGGDEQRPVRGEGEAGTDVVDVGRQAVGLWRAVVAGAAAVGAEEHALGAGAATCRESADADGGRAVASLGRRSLERVDDVDEAVLPVAGVDRDGDKTPEVGGRDAVAEVDEVTGGAPAYYMVNCAHPTHFDDVLADGGLERVRGLRANASTKSHAELDEAEELDQGDPDDLAERYRELRPLLPNLTVVGGCCGTDERHIEAICVAWAR